MVVQAQGQQAQPAGSRTPSSAVMIPRGTGRPGGGVAPPPWGYGGGVRSKSVGAVGTTGRLLVAPSETRSPTFIQQQWMGAELGVPKTPASACSAGKIALAASPAATERGSWEQPRHTSSSPPVDARASADAAAIAAQGAAAAARVEATLRQLSSALLQSSLHCCRTLCTVAECTQSSRPKPPDKPRSQPAGAGHSHLAGPTADR